MPPLEALRRIQQGYARLSRSERSVADFIRTDFSEVVLLTLEALAQRSGTSEATVLRFCRSIGYSGFQDFKSSLVLDLLNRSEPTALVASSNLKEGDDLAQLQDRVHQDVDATLAILDRSLVAELARRITVSRRVMVVGVSGSAGVATVFAFGLLASGIEAVHPVDRVEVERLCDLLTSDVVVLGISHSGNAQEVATALSRAGEAGCYNVALTHYELSPVAKAAQNILLTVGPEPLLGSNAIYPRALQLVVLEAVLAQVVRELRV